MANVYLVESCGWRSLVNAGSMSGAIAKGVRSIADEVAFKEAAKGGRVSVTAVVVKKGTRPGYVPQFSDFPDLQQLGVDY